MPHVVFETANIVASGDILSRPLIPGIEPGGSRLGHPTKPALLIQDAYMVVNDATITANDQFWAGHIDLKLSQENGLNPGLLLDVGSLMGGIAATDEAAGSMLQKDEFKARGTVWAAAFMGIRVSLNNLAALNVNVHVDYEAVDIDWMSWFIRWDHLDNITDNDRDY